MGRSCKYLRKWMGNYHLPQLEDTRDTYSTYSILNEPHQRVNQSPVLWWFAVTALAHLRLYYSIQGGCGDDINITPLPQRPIIRSVRLQYISVYTKKSSRPLSSAAHYKNTLTIRFWNFNTALISSYAKWWKVFYFHISCCLGLGVNINTLWNSFGISIRGLFTTK